MFRPAGGAAGVGEDLHDSLTKLSLSPCKDVLTPISLKDPEPDAAGRAPSFPPLGPVSVEALLEAAPLETLTTPEEDRAMAQLKEQFADLLQGAHFPVSDHTIVRFLRARDLDIDAAAEMLKNNMAFRKERNLDHLSDFECHTPSRGYTRMPDNNGENSPASTRAILENNTLSAHFSTRAGQPMLIFAPGRTNVPGTLQAANIEQTCEFVSVMGGLCTCRMRGGCLSPLYDPSYQFDRFDIHDFWRLSVYSATSEFIPIAVTADELARYQLPEHRRREDGKLVVHFIYKMPEGLHFRLQFCPEFDANVAAAFDGGCTKTMRPSAGGHPFTPVDMEPLPEAMHTKLTTEADPLVTHAGTWFSGQFTATQPGLYLLSWTNPSSWFPIKVSCRLSE
ncbi:hypothetical protein H696_05350 [Fonticula alba]|uniref:CRAL/TRIO N-terminal domain-containing protein n=1 Tax=Fonticula alba TaxID=691883 RepID=A0A058Z2E7_FONAL|nr:hypothetical protein H696_05350 [Fonticula alba]KCV68098.1 hypothetical protein H696_05350 [Fonticula alba]|eukprot:XP_009497472.1 hypothetical protein H696_05350 [Fonticula alba]